MDSPKHGDTIKFRTKSKKREWRIGKVVDVASIEKGGYEFVAGKVQDIWSKRYHTVNLTTIFPGDNWEIPTPVEVAKYKCTGDCHGTDWSKVLHTAFAKPTGWTGAMHRRASKVRVNP